MKSIDVHNVIITRSRNILEGLSATTGSIQFRGSPAVALGMSVRLTCILHFFFLIHYLLSFIYLFFFFAHFTSLSVAANTRVQRCVCARHTPHTYNITRCAFSLTPPPPLAFHRIRIHVCNIVQRLPLDQSLCLSNLNVVRVSSGLTGISFMTANEWRQCGDELSDTTSRVVPEKIPQHSDGKRSCSPRWYASDKEYGGKMNPFPDVGRSMTAVCGPLDVYLGFDG